MDLIDRSDAYLRALAADGRRLTLATRWAAGVVTVWSCSLSVLINSNTVAPVIAAVVFVAGAAGIRLTPRWRSVLLGLTAGVVVLGTPDAPFLAPAASALIVAALVDDPAPVPWFPLTTAALGAVGSLVFFNYLGSVSPFLAAMAGAAAGLLVRSTGRSGRLEQEAGELRGQTMWLEQRTALARELHDVVGHHVTAMVVQAESGLVVDPDRALREIADVGRTALGELDALVVHLRDPDAPLATSAPPRLLDIDELLAAPLRAQGVQVTVDVETDLVLDEVRTLAVYRIVQEALTNVARHARATAAAVDVRAVSGHLRVRVSDDGVGAPSEPERGSGLVGIGERVSAHGGFWELFRCLGGGTVLDVVIPPDRIPS